MNTQTRAKKKLYISNNRADSAKKLTTVLVESLVAVFIGARFRIPWSKNLPTTPTMVNTGKDGIDFETEKAALQATIAHFAHLSADAALAGHPIFGAMNKDEWGRIIYKHLDHHLKQFGV